jgi:hypothetical protein
MYRHEVSLVVSAVHPPLLQNVFSYISNKLLAAAFEVVRKQDADKPLALYLPSTVILVFPPTLWCIFHRKEN